LEEELSSYALYLNPLDSSNSFCLYLLFPINLLALLGLLYLLFEELYLVTTLSLLGVFKNDLFILDEVIYDLFISLLEALLLSYDYI